MTKDELIQMLEAIMKRADPKYTTPSGAFLDLISKFASELKLDIFAEACEMYISVHPETSTFIASRVPGILCNRYFTVHPGVDYERFIQWSINTPNWGDPLKENYSSHTELEKSANEIILVVNSYTS